MEIDNCNISNYHIHMRINYLLILVMLQLSIPMMFQLFKPRPMLLPSSMTAGNHGQEVLHNLRCSQSGDSGALGSTDRTIPNPNPKKLPKVNPFALTKKINTKIQALASKQTDIIVWTTNVFDADLLLDCSLKQHGQILC